MLHWRHYTGPQRTFEKSPSQKPSSKGQLPSTTIDIDDDSHSRFIGDHFRNVSSTERAGAAHKNDSEVPTTKTSSPHQLFYRFIYHFFYYYYNFFLLLFFLIIIFWFHYFSIKFIHFIWFIYFNIIYLLVYLLIWLLFIYCYFYYLSIIIFYYFYLFDYIYSFITNFCDINSFYYYYLFK